MAARHVGGAVHMEGYQMSKSPKNVARKPATSAKGSTSKPDLTLVNDNMLSISGNVKASENAKPIAFNMVLDFTNCPQSALLRAAAQAIIVRIQGNVRRDIKSKANKNVPHADIVAKHMSGRVNMGELLANMKAPRGDKVASLMKRTANMTPEQKQALAKLFTAK